MDGGTNRPGPSCPGSSICSTSTASPLTFWSSGLSLLSILSKHLSHRRDPESSLLKSPYRDFPGGSDGKASAYNLEDPVQSLGRKDPLEKGMAPHSSTLAWKIHGRRSLVGYSPWGGKELDTTEQLNFLNFNSEMACC